MSTSDEKRQELITALKSHDWYYERADDMIYYRRGRDERQRILRLVAEVPDGEALFNSHRPNGA